MQPANRTRRVIVVIYGLFAMTFLHVPATVADEQSQEDREVAIPKGMRVVSVRVSGDEPGLSSLKPGEEVDIFHRSEAGDAENKQQGAPAKLVADNVKVFAINGVTAPLEKSSHLETVAVLASTEQTKVIAAAQEEGVLELRRRDKKNAPVTSATLLNATTESPFGGEWRFHSFKQSPYADIPPEQVEAGLRLMKSQVFIRDGVMHHFSTTTKFEVEPVDQFTWRVTGPDIDETDQVLIRRLGSVLRMESADSDTGEFTVQTQEFRKVAPERTRIIEEVTNLTSQLSEARAKGPLEGLLPLENRIAALNASLERIDRLPDSDSLLLDALIAREAGEHSKAAKLEEEAKQLSSTLTGTTLMSGPDGQTRAIESVGNASDAPSESNLKQLSEELEQAEAAAITAAMRLKELNASETPSQDEIQATEKQLRQQVTNAFDLRWQLQDLRLRKSRFDLKRLETKHQQRKELADEIIARRLEALHNGDETAWLQTHSDASASNRNPSGLSAKMSDSAGDTSGLPEAEVVGHSVNQGALIFDSPETLLVYVSDPDVEEDAAIKRYIDVLTVEEQQRVAGVALRMVSAFKDLAGLMALGSLGTDKAEKPDELDLGKLFMELNSVVDFHRVAEPSPDAQAAYERIQIKLNLLTFVTGYVSPPAIPVSRYSEQLRKASGILDDPRTFLHDLAAVALKFANTSKETAEEEIRVPRWKVSVNGDTAVAIDENATPPKDKDKAIKPSSRLELLRSNGTWRISSVLSDEMIRDLQSGVTAKDKDDEEAHDDVTVTPAVDERPAVGAQTIPVDE